MPRARSADATAASAACCALRSVATAPRCARRHAASSAATPSWMPSVTAVAHAAPESSSCRVYESGSSSAGSGGPHCSPTIASVELGVAHGGEAAASSPPSAATQAAATPYCATTHASASTSEPPIHCAPRTSGVARPGRPGRPCVPWWWCAAHISAPQLRTAHAALAALACSAVEAARGRHVSRPSSTWRGVADGGRAGQRGHEWSAASPTASSSSETRHGASAHHASSSSAAHAALRLAAAAANGSCAPNADAGRRPPAAAAAVDATAAPRAAAAAAADGAPGSMAALLPRAVASAAPPPPPPPPPPLEHASP